MNKTYLFITALFVLIFMSCQSRKKNNAEKQNEIELVAEKQLVFPLDEQTYYLSKSMFQFEENGKEYLHFENTRKSSQNRPQRVASCIWKQTFARL